MTNSSPEIALIVAMTKERVIGKNNSIPWHISEDLINFKRITSGNVIIMGRKTYESIGRPLPNRTNYVISRTMAPCEGVEIFDDIDSALEKASELGVKIFFIGGSDIYKEAINRATTMYISWVSGTYEGDVTFPEFDEALWDIVEETPFEEFVLKKYVKR